MEIKLKKEEEVKLIYRDCPMCGESFNSDERKKTNHHIIPKVLKPLTNNTMTICLECHGKLNKLTGQFEINSVAQERKAEDYDTFMTNFAELRKKFSSNEIHRGEFGEGLWSNLTSFLGVLNDKINEKEKVNHD